MTRIINVKRHLHFAFAFVKHAYLLISVCKMNYHTDIVNFFWEGVLIGGGVLESGAYFENFTF